jgi:osmoprotectant transport system substrate-binding protein
MAPRQHRLGPAAVCLLMVLLPACTVRLDTRGQSKPVVVTGDDEITVGSFAFPESVLLAEIYAQALESKGFTIRRALNLGPRELVEPALQRGLIEFVPEYLGTALQFLEPGSRATSGDVEAARQAFIEALRSKGVDVLASAPAQDANALAVTAQTAARFGLETITDLIPVASQLVLGGPPECPSRPLCLLGLRSTYRLTFKEFMPLDASGPLTAAALASGQVDVAVLFSTDGNIAARGFVVLRDDKVLQPPENITPVARKEVVARYGRRFTDIVDAVSSKLTTLALRELNRQMSLSQETPEALARDWLLKRGLIQS